MCCSTGRSSGIIATSGRSRDVALARLIQIDYVRLPLRYNASGKPTARKSRGRDGYPLAKENSWD